MSRTAVILVGGKGTRLRPYTVVLPKPLMPIGEFPILEVVIRQLAYFKFDHLILAVNHQAELIKAFCGDGSRWGLKIDYSLEDRELSTMGPLKLIPRLPENFLLLNGDVLTDLDFGALYEGHVRDGRVFTVSASRRTHVMDYGILEVDENHFLSGFQEKPQFHYLVSMGVYVLSRAVLAHIPEGQRYGFDNLMLDLLQRRERVHVEIYDGYWLDIGRVDDYMRAIDEFEQMRSQLIRDV
jgi:NDP-sugar pyrophosphorylase family protein